MGDHAAKLNRTIRQGFIELFDTDENENLDGFIAKTRQAFEQDDELKPDSALENEFQAIALYFLEKFTPGEADGVAVSTGKFTYPYIKKAFADQLNFQKTDFRILPTETRFLTGFSRLTDSVFCAANLPVTMDVTDDAYVFSLRDNSQGARSRLQMELLAGILIACSADLSGGRTYRYELEERCGATVLHLMKKAISH